MVEFRRSSEFDAWFRSLRDLRAKARIAVRLSNAQLGNFGDVKPLGEKVYEMRIDVGPGYRIYYMRMDEVVYLLLCGGDKSSQDRDIARAKSLAELARRSLG